MRRAPAIRITGDISHILAGKPVRARDWQITSQLSNWLVSRGRALVPAYRPVGISQSLTAGSAYEYAYWMEPSYYAVDRLWSVVASGRDIAIAAGGATSINAFGGQSPANLPLAPNWVPPVTVIERMSSHSSTGATVKLQLPPPNAAAGVYQLACAEFPRYQLAITSADDGVDPTQFASSQPIQRRDYDNLWDVSQDTTHGLRCLINTAVPHKVAGLTSTIYTYSSSSATFAGVFAEGVPALGRVRYRGDTTKAIAMRAYCWVSAGGAGEIRSDYDGTTGAATAVTNTTPAWKSVASLTIDAEDLDVTDGRRGSAWKLLNLDFRATSGTIYVASVSAHESN